MNSNQRLNELFKTHLVLHLKDVMEHLDRSRTSTMRYFKEVGYYTSYNCAGEYYTLSTIPAFDKNGLWKYGGAYFSSHGSLRDTAAALVRKSEYGYTHGELRNLLGIRMYNTLLGLVNDGLIIREEIFGEYVYVSCDHGEEQISARRNIPPKIKEKRQVVKRMPRITPAAGLNETIEVLLAFIGGYVRPESAYGYLYRKGVCVTPKQVRAIFECYSLDGKKTHISRLSRTEKDYRHTSSKAWPWAASLQSGYSGDGGRYGMPDLRGVHACR